MSKVPRAMVIRAGGTNCDGEMRRGFELAGARAELVHVDRLIESPERVAEFDLIGFPGGFSYGDDVAAGRILAVRLREHLYPALRDAARRGVPMIGACNGFQVMVQVGLLPGPEGGEWPEDEPPRQRVSLTDNAGGRFVDRWVGVEFDAGSACIWTKGVAETIEPEVAPEVLMLPVGHGEGRFVAESPGLIEELSRRGQVAVRYKDNFNGSEGAVAGICDESGRIFGLMPHPERYLDWNRHPFWTRLSPRARAGETPGLRMFRNAVEAVAGAAVR